MASKLIITHAENLQEKINKVMKNFEGSVGVYVSLNKTEVGLREIFDTKKINTTKTFFVDCVSTEKTRDDILYMSPSNTEILAYAIKTFMESIGGEKFLVIDALSTLLIYNDENKVAAFVNELLKHSNQSTKVIAFSPETKGEELLKKIFNFFDKVEKY